MTRLNFKHFSQTIICIILFIIFLCLFGYQSYERLLKEEVIIKEGNIYHNEAPAMAICGVRFIRFIYCRAQDPGQGLSISNLCNTYWRLLIFGGL